MGASYTHHLIQGTRQLTVPSVQTLQSNYQAGVSQAFMELSQDVDMGQFTLTPFGSLALVNVSTSGFSETGGSAALTSAGDSMTALISSVGLRSTSDLSLGDSVAAKLDLGLSWQHAFADTPDVSNRFIGGAPFTVAGLPIASDTLNLDVGVNVEASKMLTVGLDYNGQFATSGQSHKVALTAAGQF